MARFLWTINMSLVIFRLLTMAFLSGLLGLFSCKESAYEESKKEDVKEEFSWAPGADAPRVYPAEIIRAYFYKGDQLALIPGGSVVNDTWGSYGRQMGGGSFIPEGLKITFLSFVENKFYTGDFKLPSDTILHYFQKGYVEYRTKKKVTYGSILVGMAPGGVVVVWLAGDSNHQVEIGRYQATETQVDMKQVNPSGERDRDVYVKAIIDSRQEVVENLKENGIQFGLHDSYRAKYTWRPQIFLPEGAHVKFVELEMFNAEKEMLFDEEWKKNEYTKRAIPKEVGMVWVDKDGKEYGAVIYLNWNEPETFEAFKQIYQKDRETKADLVIKLFQNKKLDAFKVYLRTEKEEFELEDTDNGTYPMED